MLIWVGSQASPALVRDVFGVESPHQIDTQVTELPVLDNDASRTVRTIVDGARDLRRNAMRVSRWDLWEYKVFECRRMFWSIFLVIFWGSGSGFELTKMHVEQMCWFKKCKEYFGIRWSDASNLLTDVSFEVTKKQTFAFVILVASTPCSFLSLKKSLKLEEKVARYRFLSFFSYQYTSNGVNCTFFYIYPPSNSPYSGSYVWRSLARRRLRTRCACWSKIEEPMVRLHTPSSLWTYTNKSRN